MRIKMPRGCLVAILVTSAITFVTVSIVVIWLQSSLPVEFMPPYIAQPIQLTQENVELSSKIVGNAREVGTLPAPKDASGVTAIIQAVKDGQILAVYGSGIFRRWDLETFKYVAEYDFMSASPDGVNFSADGTMVITPGRVDSPKALNGYTVWNTQTGEILECWGAHCPRGEPNGVDFTNLGLTLDPAGRWIVEYGGSTIGADSLDANTASIIDLYDYGFKIDRNVRRLVFDPSGKYLAYALKEGEIKVYETDDFLGPTSYTPSNSSNNPTNAFVGSRTYGNYSAEADIDTVDLAIDYTRTWLAWLNDTNLVVWNLRRPVFSRQIQVPIENGNVIAFNHGGSLLGVGTSSGILVYDLKNKKQVAAFEVGGVTALNFTRDDRLLIWGDAQGNIHLWGVPQ